MYYSVYKTTNTINGKIYIGCHKTENLDDGYIGSGKYLQYAIKKYGRENFKKEILAVFDNKEDMFEMESVLVDDEFIESEVTYNLKKGGDGGFDFINSNISFENRGFDYINKNGMNNTAGQHLIGSKKHLELLKSDLNYRDEWISKLKENHSRPFAGKKHTDDAKKKIGAANAKHQKGQNNSHFGKIWIYSLIEKVSKSIKIEDLPEWESKGWIKGRKIKFL